jgi:hypothetical protein
LREEEEGRDTWGGGAWSNYEDDKYGGSLEPGHQLEDKGGGHMGLARLRPNPPPPVHGLVCKHLSQTVTAQLRPNPPPPTPHQEMQQAWKENQGVTQPAEGTRSCKTTPSADSIVSALPQAMPPSQHPRLRRTPQAHPTHTPRKATSLPESQRPANPAESTSTCLLLLLLWTIYLKQ